MDHDFLNPAKRQKTGRKHPPEIRVVRLDTNTLSSLNSESGSVKNTYKNLVKFQASRKRPLSFLPLLHKGTKEYSHLHLVVISSSIPRSCETLKQIFSLHFEIDVLNNETFKQICGSAVRFSFDKLNNFKKKYFNTRYYKSVIPFKSVEEIKEFQSTFRSDTISSFFDLLIEWILAGASDFYVPIEEECFCDGEIERHSPLQPIQNAIDLSNDESNDDFDRIAAPPEEFVFEGMFYGLEQLLGSDPNRR